MMRGSHLAQRMFTGLGATVFASAALLAQQPGVSQRPTPVGTAVIDGKVVDAGDGSPVADAVVTATISAAGAPPGQVVTDAKGRFLFRNVPKGTAGISAEAAGYLNSALGGLRPSPLLIDVPDEARLEVTIRLVKYAVISGTVTDEAGEPVGSDSVRVFPKMVVSGRTKLSTPLTVLTDDRGAFRFSGLVPGEYVLAHVASTITMPASVLAESEAARAKGPDASQAFSNELSNSGAVMLTGPGSAVGDWRLMYGTNARPPSPTDDGQVFVYPTIFYPGATSVTGATIISLHSGEERSGLAFQLRPARSVRVSGTVTSPAGPAGHMGLRLVSADADEFATDATIDPYVTMTLPNGDFTFLGVSPGSYALKAVSVPRARYVAAPGGGGARVQVPEDPTMPSFWGTVPVIVGDADVADVVLTLRTGARVSGHVEFDGTSTPPTPQMMQTVSVSVEPPGSATGGAGPFSFFQAWRGSVNENGAFLSPQLPAGRYFVRALGSLRGWTLDSVTAAGHDAIDAPLEVESSDVTDVTIRFTDRPSGLAGTVRDAPQPSAGEADVLVFPVDTKAWVDYGPASRRVRTTPVTAARTFSISPLPPGDYFVVAAKEADVSGWPDPAVLAQLAQAATRVTVAADQLKNVDIAMSVIK